jgi:hypothetical protein
MESESLNQLIARLQHLHLEQQRILQALENIGAEDNNPAKLPTIAAPVAVQVPVVPIPVPEPIAFHIGQQVYITNRINHISVRHATEADRTAMVTHFTASHVAIRTINGYHTHRHPKNLRPL